MKIEKTNDYTVYIVSDNEKFRIKQTKENVFVIQRLFKVVETKGYLWWKKTTSSYKWESVDNYGQALYNSCIEIYIINLKHSKSYSTLEDAIKWIEDYSKYPVYH